MRLNHRLARAADYHAKALLSRHYYGNQMPWQRRVRQRHWADCYQRLRSQEPVLADMLSDALRATGRDPRKPCSRHSDALFLLDLIIRTRPRRVLECGAGISTMIIAYALERLERDTGQPREFVSFDENALYIANLVLPILPMPYWHRVSLFKRPVGYWQFTNRKTGAQVSGIGFEHQSQIIREGFDFIYVDGPQVRQGSYSEDLVKTSQGTVPPEVGSKPFDCDALRLITDKPVTVVIDQRIGTRWAFRQLLDKPYGCAYHFAARKSVFTIPPAAVANLTAERIA